MVWGCARTQTILKAIFEKYKGCVPQKKGKGRCGYNYQSIVNAFVLMLLRGIRSEEGLAEYLTEHLDEAKLCGFTKNIPHRTTLGRFRKRLGPEFLEGIHSMLLRTQAEKITHILVDSTSLEKKKDPEAKGGYSATKGLFKGFKAHIVSDADMRIPLTFAITTGNRQDGPLFPSLIRKTTGMGYRPIYVITDAGFDSEENHKTAMSYGILPVIPINKRCTRHSKYKKYSSLRLNPEIPRDSRLFKELQSKRFIAEEVNSALKQLLDTQKLYVNGLRNVSFYVCLACLIIAAFYFAATKFAEIISPWKVCYLKY